MEGIKQMPAVKRQVPEMIFTEDKTKPYDSGYEFFDRETRWKDIHRGPILRLLSPSMELLLKFNKKPKSIAESDLETKSEGISSEFSENTRKSLGVESEFMEEASVPFSCTPKCKQTRLIVLTNEGTTTIRYQWLRFPPSKAMRTMLANPRFYLNLNDESGEQETIPSLSPLRDSIATVIASGYGNHLSKPRRGQIPSLSDIDYSNSYSHSLSSESFRTSTDEQRLSISTAVDYQKAKEIIGKKPGFLRDAAFDFHFREMPGMLLPGQKVEISILYRPRKPGYCHENLYLLTHPRLTDEYDRTYMARLNGICMEPDCSASGKDKDTGKERSEPESVKRAVTKTMLELEGADLIDSALDHALYMNQKRNTSTLPFGKLTPEAIFYAHNPQLNYHYGIADRALKTVRKIIQVLIPKHRIEMEDEICSLSIKDLYSLLWNKPEADDFFRSRFKTTTTEKLLRTLAKCSRILTRPPIYAYANAGARKHMACTTNMMAVMDSIFEKMDSIKANFTETPLYRIQRGLLEQNVRKKKLAAYNRAVKKEKEAQLKREFCAKEEAERQALNGSNVGEIETGVETDFPATATSLTRSPKPPTGEGTKEFDANILPVETLGTPFDDETETRSSPGAEMESKDEETASVPEETQKTDDEETADVSKEIKDENEIETQGKKNSDEKSKKNKEHRKESNSDTQIRKTKKTKRDKSHVDRLESKRAKTKPKEKEKKPKDNSVNEDKTAGVEVDLEDELESTAKGNSPLGRNISPESVKDSTPVEKKVEKKDSTEHIYGDVEAEVEEMLRIRTERKIRQARLIAFENMLGCGIERMLSIIDTMKNFNDYKSSQIYPGEKNCCQEE